MEDEVRVHLNGQQHEARKMTAIRNQSASQWTHLNGQQHEARKMTAIFNQKSISKLVRYTCTHHKVAKHCAFASPKRIFFIHSSSDFQTQEF